MPPANDENAGAEPLVTASSAPAVPPSPPPVDEGPSPFVQEGVPRKHLHAASVTFLDGTKHVFYVHRNADADILYTLVTDFLQLNEKDYFGLAFYDEQTIRQWLYKDKKIVKTLKGRPWEFTFEVKFYPPEPSQLADDLTKYLLHLQLKNDIVTEKLPATFATHALLGSYIAQAEFGDYVPNLESYDAFLRNARIAPIVTSDLMDKVRELHRQNKGQTAQEAELNYLNTCKKLSMYGVTLFEAKDNKGKSVHIGVSAHGVSVYNDQIRIHRFVWQSIIKIAYRRNVFSIRLKAGEIEKKEATVSYKLADYPSAKRLWKCAVEYHTFFRLMQPEDKPKKHLLRWGSARFRYLGRTHFQTTMASQMFDSATASERPQSARAVSRSADDIAAKVHKEPTSPLHYVDENSKELVSSPEKTYDVSASGSPKKKKSKQKQQSVVAAAAVEHIGKEKKEKKRDKKEKKDKKDKKKKDKKKKKKGKDVSSSSSSSSDASDVEVEERHIEVSAPVHEEASLPHTTVHTWHETSAGPETVTTEVDEHGNTITRTLRSQQVKHTIQKQSYQTYEVDENNPTAIGTVERSHEILTPIGEKASSRSPVLETHTRTVAYENGDDYLNANASDVPGELISSKAVTTGNRTVETLTYKIEKDGVVETRVEHRVTIHGGDDIDHDAELSRAILEATKMNPEMTVEKIEVKQETQG